MMNVTKRGPKVIVLSQVIAFSDVLYCHRH